MPPTSRRTARPAAQKGGFRASLGISRGGRTSKLHGLTDALGRPRLLMLSAGNINDMTMAGALIDKAAGRFDRLIADRGYDTNAIRAAIAARASRSSSRPPPADAPQPL